MRQQPRCNNILKPMLCVRCVELPRRQFKSTERKDILNTKQNTHPNDWSVILYWDYEYCRQVIVLFGTIPVITLITLNLSRPRFCYFYRPKKYKMFASLSLRTFLGHSPTKLFYKTRFLFVCVKFCVHIQKGTNFDK